METFIIFLLGIILTLCVVGVVWSVKSISSMRKETQESLDEIEDYTASIDEIRDLIQKAERVIVELDAKHDNINEGIYINLDTLDSNQKQIVDRLEELEDLEEEQEPQ
jgi:septal ring factor EnvC (AmiA/AmiB activator)